jgi:DNA-binding transcriptional LysR family regulator
MDRLMSLRAFQRVADEGSFAAAARALDLSPAVVTRLVADLEAHLGARLLQRTTRRVALTEVGQAYLERLRPILQDLDDANAMVSTLTAEPTGLLRVHTVPALATHVLGPMLAGFRHAYPRIRLLVHVDNQPDPPIEDYDVTLLGVREDFNAQVVARRLLSGTEAILVASPAYLTRRGTPSHPLELAAHDCLRTVEAATRHGPWRLFRPEAPDDVVEVDVTPALWSNHTDTLIRAALDGAGITSVTVELVASQLASGELVRVLHPWINGRLALYAALPSRKYLPQRTRVFLDYLTDYIRQAVQQGLAG